MIRLLSFLLLSLAASAGAKDQAPLFRDFVGVCGHTVNFSLPTHAKSFQKAELMPLSAGAADGRDEEEWKVFGQKPALIWWK
jgi:hypothetical protein